MTIGGDLMGNAIATSGVNEDHRSSAQIDDPRCITGSISEITKSACNGPGHERYVIAINRNWRNIMKWEHTHVYV